MRHSRNVVQLPDLVALDERVDRARARLQRTTEADPAFERRVQTVVELVRKRDRASFGDGLFRPPAA